MVIPGILSRHNYRGQPTKKGRKMHKKIVIQPPKNVSANKQEEYFKITNSDQQYVQRFKDINQPISEHEQTIKGCTGSEDVSLFTSPKNR